MDDSACDQSEDYGKSHAFQQVESESAAGGLGSPYASAVSSAASSAACGSPASYFLRYKHGRNPLCRCPARKNHRCPRFHRSSFRCPCGHRSPRNGTRCLYLCNYKNRPSHSAAAVPGLPRTWNHLPDASSPHGRLRRKHRFRRTPSDRLRRSGFSDSFHLTYMFCLSFRI